MLKQDEIARRLDAAKKVKPWLEARLDRLAGFDSTIRSVGQFLLGCDEKGKQAAGARSWKLRTKGAVRLRKLDGSVLLHLGEALFPRDPDVFKAAWNLHEQLPYQGGSSRKPFRAPTRSDLLIERRRGFLANLMSLLEGYDEDLPWLAAHAPYLAPYSGSDQLGLLFAGAIDSGGNRGEEVE